MNFHGGFNICPQIFWYSFLQEVEVWIWIGLSDLLQMSGVWAGKNSHFTVEKPGRQHPTKWSKLTSPIKSHVDIMYWWWCNEKGTSPLDFSSSKIHNPMRKKFVVMRKPQKNPNGGTLYKISEEYKCQSHEKQRKSEILWQTNN